MNNTNNNNNNNFCSFKKYYKDDNNTKYNLLSTSLFYYNKYERFIKDKRVSAVDFKQLTYFYNTLKNIENLYIGFFPNDWKMRIFFDKSLFNYEYNGVKIWNIFFNKIKNLDKIQLVEFKCHKFYNENKIEHKRLFGTILRFYPLFNQSENKNVKSIHIVDVDNFYLKKWLDSLINFNNNSKFQIHTFCSHYEFPTYRYNIFENDFCCYFRAGMFSSKVFFKKNLWNNMINQIYDSNSQFSKITKNIYKRIYEIYPSNNNLNSDFYLFDFGYDEIILNYFIKSFILKNNYKVQYTYYKPSVGVFVNYLTQSMKYHKNLKYTKEFFYNFYKNNNILKKNNMNNNNNLNNLLDKFRKKGNKLSYNNIKFQKFINDLKKYLYLFEKMDMDPILIDFIKNYNYNKFIKYPKFDKYFSSIRINIPN